MLAGAFAGAACLVKYQAAIYLALVWAIICLPPSVDERAGQMKGRRVHGLWWSAIGFASPLLAMFSLFALRGALLDLWVVTVQYNLHYSGETFAGPLAFARYLVSMPVQHARVDGLWLLGGAG